MNWFRTASAAGITLAVLSVNVAFAAGQSHSQPGQPPAKGEIKIVQNPGGGEYAFGTLASQSNKTDALVYMLHQVHGKFGEKPQVGKLIQSKDGTSLAAFFTVTAKSTSGKPIAGLVIITQRGNSSPQMGILYDFANRFVTTEPGMLQAVSAAYQATVGPAAGSPAPRSRVEAPSTPKGGPVHLNMATAGDRSAVIGLPDGWHLTSVAGGSLIAEGNHGEMMFMGMIFQQIIDPRSPAGQNILRMPNNSPKARIVYPMGGDLFAAFVSVFNQIRRNNGKAQGSFTLTSSTNLPPDSGGPAIQAIFTVDFNDGIGPRKGSARIGAMITRGSPMWALSVSMTNIPAQYADAEQATMLAAIRSYSQDGNVIAREGAADLNRIHQQAIANQAQADAINSRREANAQSFDSHMQTLKQNDAANDEHMGNIDWQSKITQDYILDRSVVKDVEDDGTATVGNKFADALVKAAPNRFEIVPNSQLIRGRDY
ncbi:MAG TPA: hypothetical protein VK574_01420 [Terracidiphilus sp.]|nr:hypothetical protein [Terracidiphilus sp.]